MSTQLVSKNAGAQNVWLDILASNGTRKTDITYTDITITYLTDTASTPVTVTLVAGTVGTVLSNSFVHYSNGVYQLTLPADAFLVGKNLLIQWSGAGIATGEKNFAFADVYLGINDDIPYTTSTLIKLRVLIDDLDSDAYKYSDNRLSQLLMVSACYVQSDISAEYAVDIQNATITPEPNDSINNLIVLKAACLLVKSEAKSAAGCSVKIIDGPSTMDLDGIYKNTSLMSKDFCEDYQKSLIQYKLLNSFGCSSITPTTTYWCW